MRPRCEFAASTAAKGFCTTACSAQPTRLQPTPRTIVRLRLLDTCNTAASDSIEGPPGKKLFGERKQPTRDTPHLAADYRPVTRAIVGKIPSCNAYSGSPLPLSTSLKRLT